MEGLIPGIQLDHGEGRFTFPNKDVLKKIPHMNLAPIRYANDHGELTEDYPFNPNGSELGIAGLCSPDGRHLWMMPHPERTAFKHQWHYLPDEFDQFNNSPWLRLFQNAYRWCKKTKDQSIAPKRLAA